MPSSTKPELKIVLDANVWVSALIWGGKPAQIIEAAENGTVCIFTSEEILAEISQVLNYQKIKNIYQGTGLRHEDLMTLVLQKAQIIPLSKRLKAVLEHPADDKFIECAQEAGADYIISGDKHLLKLAAYQKTQIASASTLLETLETLKTKNKT